MIHPLFASGREFRNAKDEQFGITQFKFYLSLTQTRDSCPHNLHLFTIR